MSTAYPGRLATSPDLRPPTRVTIAVLLARVGPGARVMERHGAAADGLLALIAPLVSVRDGPMILAEREQVELRMDNSIR